MNLPEMTVELRESTTAHGIPAPDLSEANLARQIQQTLILNEGAKVDGWDADVLDILTEYVSGDASDIVQAVEEVTGFTSWKEATIFVQEDECLEFFNYALKYCKREGQRHKREKDFIDGSGIGYVKEYTKQLKVYLEQTFDAKYFFKVPRPLVYMKDKFGIDLSLVANHIHPGHWSYPAGHGCKFLVAYKVLSEVFMLDRRCDFILKVAAETLSMGRTGSAIHYPMDNLAARALLAA